MIAVILALAAAATPASFEHQLRLLDASGAPISGAHDLTLRVYGAGSDPLWTELHEDVQVTDGFAAVQLGAVSPFPADLWTDGPRSLGVTVGTGVELAPRAPILAVPFALTAAQVPRAASAPAACAAQTAGRLYFDDTAGQLRVCNGAFWTGLGASSGAGETAAAAVASCEALHALRPELASGSYWLDPDGAASGFSPMRAWCDMGASSPGWTLCANFIDTAGNDLVNSQGGLTWGLKSSITDGIWLTGATEIPDLATSGTFDCAAFAAAVGATEIRYACAGGSTSFDSGALPWSATALAPSGTVLGAYTLATHGEWLWGGYGERSWVLTTRSGGYANCSGNTCGSNGMGWDDGPTRIEIIGGGGDGCSNGCSRGDIWYSGADEGANCNGQSMRGVSGDRYSIYLR